MSWLGIKAKLWGIGAVLLGAFAFVLRLNSLKNQRDRARIERDQAKAQAKQQKVYRERVEKTAELDAEIEQEFSHRAEEAQKDKEAGNVPKHVSKDSINDF